MKAPLAFGGAFLLVALAFLLVPGLDLTASRVFYEPGAGFPLAASEPLRLFEKTVPWLAWGIAGLVLAGGVSLAAGRRLWRLDARALVFVALATALGPGLLANTVLKDHWGRARPYQTEIFGGSRVFTPAPLIAHQCARNCAFVSGHAALGFSLVSFAFLLPAGRRRRAAVVASIGFGALVGLGRIAVGHHFFSDVVYAGFLVTGTSWLLYRAIVVENWPGRAWRTPGGRLALAAGTLAAIEAAALLWIDRPLALYLHETAVPVQPYFAAVTRLGLAYPYLVLFALMFAALYWGGALPPWRERAAALREKAATPAFLFAAVAASGLAVDLLKIVFGRTRPKLLFADGAYDFGWFGWQADYWSFPSGHAATAAALMAALWWLWPRYAPLYVPASLLVIASRVVVGAHYLSDAVMGAAIGIATTWALAEAFARRGYGFGGRPTRAV